MKCINKDCNYRVGITKKIASWQVKKCKCNIEYWIKNSEYGFSNLYFIYNIGDYGTMGSLGTSNNSYFRKIWKIKRNSIIFLEYDTDNKLVLNSKNIHRKLKQDLNFCIKYINNLIFL